MRSIGRALGTAVFAPRSFYWLMQKRQHRFGLAVLPLFVLLLPACGDDLFCDHSLRDASVHRQLLYAVVGILFA